MVNTVLKNRLLARLPWVAIAVLVVFLLWMVARMVWLGLDGPALPSAEMPPVPEIRDRGNAGPDTVWDVFGETAAPAPVIARDAPPTELSLRLRGVIAGLKGQGLAVISDDGTESVFRTGDEIRSGVTVQAIEPRRVIIRRDGNDEALELPDDRLASGSESPRSGGAVPGDPPTVPVTMPGFRDDSGFSAAGVASMGSAARDMGMDAQALAESISIQPVSDGGFRVRPGRDARVFEQLGLQAGDVVVAVNGQRLQTEADAMAIFEQVQESGDLAITVRRDGREQTLTPDLGRLGN